MASYLHRFDETPTAERWPLVRRWMLGEPLTFFDELRRNRPVLATHLPCDFQTAATSCSSTTSSASRSIGRSKVTTGCRRMTPPCIGVKNRSCGRFSIARHSEDLDLYYVANKAAALIAAACGAMDIVSGLTRAVPLALVQDWFGFADSDPAELQRWSYWNQMDAFWNQPFDAIAAPDPQKIVAEREVAMTYLCRWSVLANAIVRSTELSRAVESERKACTARVTVLNRNARHMRVSDAPHDCKAEARAPRLTAITTPKATKQKFSLVLVDSRTLIKDPNGSVRSHHELNNRSPRGMMNCILDKIANCSVHQVWIAFDPYRFIRRIETDFFALRNHQGRYQLDHFSADAA